MSLLSGQGPFKGQRVLFEDTLTVRQTPPLYNSSDSPPGHCFIGKKKNISERLGPSLGLASYTTMIVEGNGDPLQYSCLENPWTVEPGRLQSMGSWRVRHDWATSLSLFSFMHWRRKWQPTPVFLPGESQGRGSLVGCRLWGHTESDTTEVT